MFKTKRAFKRRKMKTEELKEEIKILDEWLKNEDNVFSRDYEMKRLDWFDKTSQLKGRQEAQKECGKAINETIIRTHKLDTQRFKEVVEKFRKLRLYRSKSCQLLLKRLENELLKVLEEK